MTTATLKSSLRQIADSLPDDASYSDAVYELYVRMKVSKGKAAAERGNAMSHDDVKRQFAK